MEYKTQKLAYEPKNSNEKNLVRKIDLGLEREVCYELSCITCGTCA